MVWEAEIDFNPRVFRQREQLVVNLLRHNGDRQQRILQRVALKNVREGTADHRAEAELRQRPQRMLARTAAASYRPPAESRRGNPRGVFRMKSGFGFPCAS